MTVCVTHANIIMQLQLFCIIISTIIIIFANNIFCNNKHFHLTQ